MKPLLIFPTAVLLILLQGSVSPTIEKPHLCDIIISTPIIAQRGFNLDLLKKDIDPKWKRLGRDEFQALLEREMSPVDTAWVMGKVVVRGSRVALFVLNRSVECDHPVKFITMHLFDGCTTVSEPFFATDSDDHGGIYERTMQLTTNCDTAVFSVSEGEVGDMGVDTVWTQVDWIRLIPTVDTVLTRTEFEVLH